MAKPLPTQPPSAEPFYQNGSAEGGSTITVTIKLFAAYQDAYGVPELTMQCTAGDTVGMVRDRLIAQHPDLEQWRNVTRFGINLDFAEPDAPLQDGDEVVLIPPVSGG
jgi:sulfur-carrier protein